jgi:hypothetical protein
MQKNRNKKRKRKEKKIIHQLFVREENFSVCELILHVQLKYIKKLLYTRYCYPIITLQFQYMAFFFFFHLNCNKYL